MFTITVNKRGNSTSKDGQIFAKAGKWACRVRRRNSLYRATDRGPMLQTWTAFATLALHE
jgi:hypothetical protein